MPFLQPLLLILLVLGSMVPAMAHPEAYHATGNHAAAMGFLHPFTGLDHLLVMVAVGLWSVQLGGRSLWMLPVTFVSTMLLGGMLGLSHHHASIIEHGIVASLLLLGVALGMAWRPPDFIAALGVGAAGICHGFAHGGEIPAGSAPLYFLSGMILATALLHLGGLVFGTTFRRHGLDRAIRLAGFGLVLFAAAAFFNLAS